MGFALFEINHGYIPWLGQCIDTDTKHSSVKQFAQQALCNLMAAHNAIIECCAMQTHHANSQQWPGEEFPPGNLVYLSTKNLALP